MKLRKPTSILHVLAGIVAALVDVVAGILIVFMFTVLELWDAYKGNNSWWDYQEFLCGFVTTKALFLGGGFLCLFFRAT